MSRYLAPSALLPDGWAQQVILTVDAEGVIVAVEPGTDGSHPEVAVPLPGPVIPGVVDAHSHAFQRALAGGAETRGAAEDSFWGWREALYDLALRMSPDQVHAVARQLYTELLEAGYTRVVEFHYLHHSPSGSPYADPIEMARRIAGAAEEAGIGITLLPVLYRYGDFGSRAPAPGQRRFVMEPEAFLRQLSALGTARSALDRPFDLGVAFHSLRAVDPASIHAVLQECPGGTPVHLHAAEQPAEVEGCLSWSGRRPVEWILDELPVDADWSLVHCTHVEPREVRALARSGATVVLCPSTEANLGDGIFPLAAYRGAGGTIAVGSDSHVSTSPVEELRWLEYGQRLVTGRRGVAATREHPSTGRALLEAVWRGGAAAAGITAAGLAPGQRADWLVLDPEHPVLAGRSGDGLLDAWVFSGDRPALREVWVGGRRVVRDGEHPRREAHAEAFRAVMDELLAG